METFPVTNQPELGPVFDELDQLDPIAPAMAPWL